MNENLKVSEETSNPQLVCTLFEGHYHLGLAVLLNSMLRGGFKGLFWAAYRGQIPQWTSVLKEVGPERFEFENGATLQFEKLGTDIHFANYKPDFILNLIRRGIATDKVWYFDPDITIRCSWSFFDKWLDCGVALCSEIVNGSMPELHPLRCFWVEAAEREGWGPPINLQNRYYNSGFVGLKISDIALLERWKHAMEVAAHNGPDPKAFMKGTREEMFYIMDQDALNLAVMYTEGPFSTIGPEGMGFAPGGFTMYHSVGASKPWRKPFLKSALRGDPPGNGDKHFLSCADGPIRPFSSVQLKAMRFSLAIGTLIGRLYRRG